MNLQERPSRRSANPWALLGPSNSMMARAASGSMNGFIQKGKSEASPNASRTTLSASNNHQNGLLGECFAGPLEHHHGPDGQIVVAFDDVVLQ